MRTAKLIGRCVTAALLAVGASVALAAPPSSGGGVTSVKNVDEEGRVPYLAYMQFSFAGCNLATDCANYSTNGSTVLFDGPIVPVGKRLVIKWVSAWFAANYPNIVLQSAQAFESVAIKWAFYGPFYNYGMSSPAFLTYGPSERPHVQVGGITSQVYGYVTISGYLIDAQ